MKGKVMIDFFAFLVSNFPAITFPTILDPPNRINIKLMEFADIFVTALRYSAK
ncbi:hypothetical protein GCM10010912_62010 [Paenibacillus albidus]|uniref:Uncharacterized protein n=1 Tax=Paenibacillus albidus TaxID=2041023 RepID=A0A917D2H7_9BACL|nr:hypothetical protein GCM10010912_62010 [Paenibacillus albidus]